MIADLDRVVEDAISESTFPGAAYGYALGEATFCSRRGQFTYATNSPSVTSDTRWDLASVSKVVGPTSLAMQMIAEHQLDLDQAVVSILPEFGRNGKGQITIRDLLAHCSGLVPFRHYEETCANSEEVLAAIFNESLEYAPRSQAVYSDLNMIVLAEVMQRILGEPMDVALHHRLFLPLGMSSTGFLVRSFENNQVKLRNLNQIPIECCAPTEKKEPWRRSRDRQFSNGESDYIQGEVHDPRAAIMGGLAGHAGLFSTVSDLLKFGQALLRGQVVAKEVVQIFIQPHLPGFSRALGWDTSGPNSSSGRHFGPRSFGHTGYTGTSLWIDPDRDLVAVLLTNRVHPTHENTQIMSFRPRFHDALVESL